MQKDVAEQLCSESSLKKKKMSAKIYFPILSGCLFLGFYRCWYSKSRVKYLVKEVAGGDKDLNPSRFF